MNEIDRKILDILLEEKKPVSSRGLALRCDVSINTIRKEIGIFNEEVKGRGFCIASKTAVGHYLEIWDHRLAEPYIREKQLRYRRNQHIANQYSEEVWYILRKCLCSGDHLTVEEFCDELHCSRRTVLRNLCRAREVLAKYELCLINRRGRGLEVRGSEWNLRQCLLYLHKIYSLSMEDNAHKEYDFKAMFFMMDGVDRYEQVRRVLIGALREQRDFFIPFMNMPKIVNYILLAASRSKKASGLRFSERQKERAKGTAEYAFVYKLKERLPARFRDSLSEEDLLALAMLLLSFETRNCSLPLKEEYHFWREETEELVEELSRLWGCSSRMFDETFREDFVCFLYTLHNRLLFRVYNETELLGFVRGKGISSADLCICFARFYEKKHGVVLGTSDTLSAFYLFHRIMRNQSDCYYAQRLLVVSRYGLQYARSLAANIRTSYSREIKTVAVREFCEVLEDDFLNYDLLITDVDSRRLGEFVSYSLPMVQTEFLLGTQNCPELDLYLERLRQETERKRIGSSSFFRTDFYGREDVFAWLEKRFEQSGMDGGRLVAQLRQNTGYLNPERQNRIVLLPVLGEGVGDSMPITVIINRTAFVWEEQNSQIFVCYARSHSWEENQVLNAILRRFVHMSVETAEKLIYCPQLEPMQILYPDISPEGL